MHISLAAEFLFSVFGFKVTNAILTTWLIMLGLIVVAVIIRRNLKEIPGKFQSAIEMVYLYFYDSAESVIGRKDVARHVMPFVMTLFFFIVISNWSGLLPGNHSFGLLHLVKEVAHASEEGGEEVISFLRPPSTDLNMVAAMALMSVAYVQYLGLKYGGGMKYLGKFFNFSSPIMFFVGILELFSEITRTVSFTFRLFGNIFAGKVLVTVIFFLTITLLPIFPILPLPFYMLEMFVGLIQAFVFCFLVIVLTSVAVADHGSH